jgi:hypothetical protein
MGEARRRRQARGGAGPLDDLERVILRTINRDLHQHFILNGKRSLEPNPSIVLFREGAPVTVMMMPNWGNAGFDEKEVTAQKLRQKIADLGDVWIYALVMETWSAPEGEVRPRDSDQRCEVILVHIVHRDGRRLSQWTEMVRDWHTGKVTELKAQIGKAGFSRLELFLPICHIPAGPRRDANGVVISFDKLSDWDAVMPKWCAMIKQDPRTIAAGGWVCVGPDVTTRYELATREMVQSPTPEGAWRPSALSDWGL